MAGEPPQEEEGPIDSASFERWIRKKELLARGLELFHQLSPDRAVIADDWKAVAVALHAVKKYYLLVTPPNEDKAQQQSQQGVAEPKDGSKAAAEGPSSQAKGLKILGPGSLYEAWRKWTIDHHPFDMIKLSPEELSKYSSGARELFQKENDDSPEADIMPTIKYTFPKRDLKKGEKPRPLTKDQQLSNAIFLRLLKEAWEDARKTLDMELKGVNTKVTEEKVEAGSKAEEKSVGGEGKEGEAEPKQGEPKEGDSKEGDMKKAEQGGEKGSEAPSKPTKDDDELAHSIAAAAPIAPAVNNGKSKIRDLYQKGLPALAKMIEEDQDKLVERKRDDDKTQEEDAKKAHDAWLRRKDATRIRLPVGALDRVRPSSPQRFDFSLKSFGAAKPVRAKGSRPYTTTVDMMIGSGLKYVHATKRSRQPGLQADLEKCRRQLLDAGIVYKDNFDQEDMFGFDLDQYHREKEENAAVAKRQKAEEERREQTEKAFAEWMQNKALSEQAVKYLEAIDPPTADTIDPSKAEEHWLNVGKRLKAVDENLYKNWVDWAKGFRPATASTCQSLWEYFPPHACDIHCKTYTAVKDIFLRLLKPGKNYKQAFQRHCERLWQKKLNEDPWADESGKKEMEENCVMDKKEMRRFLGTLGIVMQDDQIRHLIDAFDSNGDGVVSMNEFLSFVGEERPTKGGDKQLVLQQKCIWKTTCDKCGMKNAYVVSIAKTRGGLSTGTSGGGGGGSDRGGRESKEEPHIEVVELKSGERKRRVEMTDHVKRGEILKRFAITAHGDGEEKDPYGDDPDQQEDNYSEDEEHDHDRGSQKDGKSGGGPRCQSCTWPLQDRERALAFLEEASQDKRDAQALQKVLANGSPPPAPKMTLAKLGCKEVGSSADALTTELLIQWKTPPGALVAFVTLEQQQIQQQLPPPSSNTSTSQQGPVVRRVNVDYVEIARDPPDAEQDPMYQMWIRDLQPNTAYSFRMRAFNGFGAGPYAHAIFTTRPVAPQTPIMTRGTPTSITLKWKFTDVYLKRLQQLRKVWERHKGKDVRWFMVFEQADRDGNLSIDRKELLDVLTSNEPRLLGFLKKMSLGPGLSVFDAIETDDNDTISWEEFRRFFETALEGDAAVDLQASVTSLKSITSLSDPPYGEVSTKTRYVVERCESHAEEKFKDVWRGCAAEACIVNLRPGTTYRFRVSAVNSDGTSSAPSPVLVASTLLETPLPPRLTASKAGQTTSLKIMWTNDTRIGGGVLHSDKLKGTLDKTLADWAKSGILATPGVDIKLVFDKYDHNGDGTIDASELEKLLQDLGVTPTEEKIREALSQFDENDDNRISFDEFKAWWDCDEVDYVLKRRDGIPAVEWSPETNPRGDLKTVYKGSKTSFEVSGLEPNTFYEFRLRLSNARTYSALSGPLNVMTSPATPEAPTLARVETKEAVVRWYHKEVGVKYILQQRFIECLDHLQTTSGATTTSKSNKTDEDWTSIYEGPNPMAHVTGLALNSVYHLRLIAVNRMDGRSDPSPITLLSTVLRPNRSSIKPTTAADCFTVDCTGDVVEGDTILFTERLYKGEDGKLVETGSTGFAMIKSPSTGSVTPRVRMRNFSVESLASGRSAQLGEFVGERTIAAYVWRVSDRGGRPMSATTNNSSTLGNTNNLTTSFNGNQTFSNPLASPGPNGRSSLVNFSGSKKRVLRMEVVWSTVSRREVDDCLISKGTIIERSERKVFAFETFRMPWEHEKLRKSSEQERGTISTAIAMP